MDRATISGAIPAAYDAPYPHSPEPNCQVPSPTAESETPPTSTYFIGRTSLGRHADAAVQTDHFAVQVAVPNDLEDQAGVLRRHAEPLREQDRLAEGLALGLGQRGEQ